MYYVFIAAIVNGTELTRTKQFYSLFNNILNWDFLYWYDTVVIIMII